MPEVPVRFGPFGAVVGLVPGAGQVLDGLPFVCSGAAPQGAEPFERGLQEREPAATE
jgi:hypothetical protein